MFVVLRLFSHIVVIFGLQNCIQPRRDSTSQPRISCVCSTRHLGGTDDDMKKAIHWFPMRAMVQSKFLLLLVSVIFLLLLVEIQVTNLQTSLNLLEKSLDRVNSKKRRNSVVSTSYPRIPYYHDNKQNLLVIYNRVPKTGSTSFAGIAYDLCKKNNFSVLHINTTENSRVLSVQDQMRLIQNITQWSSKLPAFYHGHVAFIDFDAFGSSFKPIHINILRRPLERLVSYYFFLRYGDDYRPSLSRHRKTNKETFSECVKRNGYDCHPDRLWQQVPYFCGHAEECWKPGSRWALEQAKYNMINKYLLVGVTDEMEEFITILEATLPSMFKGASRLFQTGKRSHLRRTTKKEIPTEETLEFFHQNPVWQAEEEFYNFVLENFHAVKNRSLKMDEMGHLSAIDQQFRYEKVRPR